MNKTSLFFAIVCSIMFVVNVAICIVSWPELGFFLVLSLILLPIAVWMNGRIVWEDIKRNTSLKEEDSFFDI